MSSFPQEGTKFSPCLCSSLERNFWACVSVGGPRERPSKQPWHSSHDLWALGLVGACSAFLPPGILSGWYGMALPEEGSAPPGFIKGRLPFCLPDDQASSGMCFVHRFHTGTFACTQAILVFSFCSARTEHECISYTNAYVNGLVAPQGRCASVGLLLPVRPGGRSASADITARRGPGCVPSVLTAFPSGVRAAAEDVRGAD